MYTCSMRFQWGSERVKVSKEQVRENRARIVEAASVLFRERGYDGVGIAELMSAAGLTHGGFYKHFASKADLLSEAMSCGFRRSAESSLGVEREKFIADYLSRQHRDAMGKGCVMSALGTDTARQSESIKATFSAGIERQLSLLADENGAGSATRADLIDTLAHLVGALVLSRACPDDSTLADEILDVCRSRLLAQEAQEDVGGEFSAPIT
ncbi:Potential acrAB operon repressor [Serratia ficaria]|uniref:Potential acrAB operon repressor n=1 Tax=Serratia ficaria TaxID=61651 RepID=A0A240C895_SERFI|nr:TetR family transcriptional regulator [Serratia ficaria]CAI0728836.1 Potential acrAB operon repressor [Serratia ficaria]CAI0732150.1 Potential acrAB operon repressor [Serratia ficaria]CAI0749381.1 Potential acrAB operon repressor [Serratia ficaria]CAI0760908.1 Potential acrAB operon repressor [Serratia ficaria]